MNELLCIVENAEVLMPLFVQASIDAHAVYSCVLVLRMEKMLQIILKYFLLSIWHRKISRCAKYVIAQVVMHKHYDTLY